MLATFQRAIQMDRSRGIRLLACAPPAVAWFDQQENYKGDCARDGYRPGPRNARSGGPQSDYDQRNGAPENAREENTHHSRYGLLVIFQRNTPSALVEYALTASLCSGRRRDWPGWKAPTATIDLSNQMVNIQGGNIPAASITKKGAAKVIGNIDSAATPIRVSRSSRSRSISVSSNGKSPGTPRMLSRCRRHTQGASYCVQDTCDDTRQFRSCSAGCD